MGKDWVTLEAVRKERSPVEEVETTPEFYRSQGHTPREHEKKGGIKKWLFNGEQKRVFTGLTEDPVGTKEDTDGTHTWQLSDFRVRRYRCLPKLSLSVLYGTWDSKTSYSLRRTRNQERSSIRRVSSSLPLGRRDVVSARWSGRCFISLCWEMIINWPTSIKFHSSCLREIVI